MILNKLITSEVQLLDTINNNLISNNKLLLTYFNQNCFNVFSRNKSYKKLLEEKFQVFLDGIGIYFACKILIKNKEIIRFNATDIYGKILKIFFQKGKKIYIIGGNFSKDIVYSSLEDKVNIAGYHNGFFRSDELKNIIAEIKDIKPDVIAIGMGVPKQEFLANEIFNMIEKNIIFICVGNFFEFYFNTQKRAPLILRQLGMEWLFRLFTEPRRLWKRYLLGIPLYFMNILKYKLYSNY